MHIKALKTFIGREGSVKRGAVFETDPRRARELERRGLAVPLLDAPQSRPPATMLETLTPSAAVAGDAQILPAPLVGVEGRTLESEQLSAAGTAPEGQKGGDGDNAPHADEVAETGAANPTLANSQPESAPLPGGQIGEAVEQSSSPRAPRRKRSRSKKPATDAPDFLP